MQIAIHHTFVNVPEIPERYVSYYETHNDHSGASRSGIWKNNISITNFSQIDWTSQEIKILV